jgi:hypothetical protein
VIELEAVMKWEEARKSYPNRWLLIEARKAHSESSQRIVDELTVIADFDESKSALNRYLALHTNEPQRELYVVHSSNENLEIEERRWAGVRVAG